MYKCLPKMFKERNLGLSNLKGKGVSFVMSCTSYGDEEVTATKRIIVRMKAGREETEYFSCLK
jgi:hypothetical protein